LIGANLKFGSFFILRYCTLYGAVGDVEFFDSTRLYSTVQHSEHDAV
jgi:hypothetical protein